MTNNENSKTNNNKQLISIVLPLYNGKHLVKKSIDSILQQTYTHWELIIVDDGSVDDGAAFIEEAYPFSKIIRQKNAGVAAARNVGIRAADGQFLAFMDQDDEWMPTKLQEQFELLNGDANCAFVTCNQVFVYDQDTVMPTYFNELLFEEHRGFVPSTLLIRKQALLDVQMFDESLKVSSDFELIRKLRNAGYKELNAEKLLLKKWYHGENASLEKPALKKEILSLLFKQMKGQ